MTLDELISGEKKVNTTYTKSNMTLDDLVESKKSPSITPKMAKSFESAIIKNKPAPSSKNVAGVLSNITPQMKADIELKRKQQDELERQKKKQILSIQSNIAKIDKELLSKPVSLSAPSFPSKPSKLESDRELLQSELNRLQGKTGVDIGKTAVSTFTQLGKGILDFGESAIVDPMLQIGSSKYNPYYVFNPDQYEGNVSTANELIGQNAAENTLKFLGYDRVLPTGKTVQQTLDENSLITSTNKAGQLTRAVGQMLIPAITAQATSGALLKMGLSAKASTALAQLVGSTTMGASAYGGSLQEALNAGANREDATKYALSKFALESASEWLFGGVPGTNVKLLSKWDELAKTQIDKVPNVLAKFILDKGYRMAGEGTEEGLVEIITPFLQNATYTSGQKIDWEQVLNASIDGAIISGILDVPVDIIEIANKKLEGEEFQPPKLPENKPVPTVKKQEQKPIVKEEVKEQLPTIEKPKQSQIELPKTSYNADTNELSNLQSKLQLARDKKNNEDIAFYEKKIREIEGKLEEVASQEKVKKFESTKEKTIIEDIAKKLDVKVTYFDGPTHEQGSYNSATKEIRLNINNSNILNIATHEFVHDFKNTKEYNELKDYIFSTVPSELLQNNREIISKTYKKNGIDLTEDKLNEELVAHFIEKNMFKKEESINKLYSTNRTLFDKMYEFLKSFKTKVVGTKYEKIIANTEALYKKALDSKIEQVKQEKLPVKKEVKKVENKKEVKKEYPEYVKTEKDKQIFDSTVKYHKLEDVREKVLETKKEQPKTIKTETQRKQEARERNKQLFEKGNIKDANDLKANFRDTMSKYINKTDKSISGENALLTLDDINNLERAYKMRKSNISSGEIWAKTGWYFDKNDKKWKFEINDGELTKQLKSNVSYKLKDIYDAPDFYKYHPEFQNLIVNTKSDKNAAGSVTPGVFEINIDLSSKIAKTQQGVKELILHEMQHHLQNINSFDTGGNPLAIYILSKYHNINLNKTQIREMYKNLGGEREANIVMDRSKMGNLQRRLNVPLKDIDLNTIINGKEFWNDFNKYFDKLTSTLSEKQQDKFYEDIIKEYSTLPTATKEQLQYSLNLDSNKMMNKEDSQGNMLTDAQQQFFKDSKVRDEDGKLLEAYHGTLDNKFTIFDKNKIGNETGQAYLGSGFYFTNNIDLAKLYATDENIISSNKGVFKVYIDIKNPFIVPNNLKYENGMLEKLLNTKTPQETTSKLKKMGYDGIIYKDNREVVVFEPNQIKSVDNKNPSKDEDINYSINLDSENNKILTENNLEPIVESPNVKSKKDVKKDIIAETGLDTYDFNKAKNLPLIQLNRLHPLRVMQMVFGKETGAKLNSNFIHPMVENEARKNRFLNKERNEIKALGIKHRSKESAAIQKYGERQFIDFKSNKAKPYLLEDLKAEFPNKWEKIVEAEKIIRNKYDVYLDIINNELAQNGFNPIKKRKDYFLHFKELGVLAEVSGITSITRNLSTDMVGLTQLYKPGRKFMTSQLQRRGNYTEYDAIKGIDSYLNQIGDVIYHTRDIQKLRVLDNFIRKQYSIKRLETDVTAREKQLIKASHLGTFVSWLSEYTNVIAGKQSSTDRGIEQLMGRSMVGVAKAIKRQVGSNLVGLNPGSALSNFISVTQGAAKTNKISVVKGTYSTLKNIFFDDGLSTRSAFLTNRIGSDKLSRNWWEKTSDLGQIMMKATDIVSSNIIFRSKYEEYKSKGYDEELAIEKADLFTNKIVAGRTNIEMPTMFQSKMVGILAQFQLEVNNQMDAIFYDTFTEDYASNERRVIKHVKTYNTMRAISVFAQLLAFGYLFNEAYEELTGRRAAFDPIGTIGRAFKHYNNENLDGTEATFKVVKESLQQLPFTDMLVGGGRIPVTDAIPNVMSILEKKSDLEKELKKLPLLLSPTGGGQIRKTLDAIDLYKNKEQPGNYLNDSKLKYTVGDDAVSKTKNLIFGKYSSKEAKEYYDNNWQPLSEKQTKFFIKSGLPMKEFRKYTRTLNDRNRDWKDTDEYGEDIRGSVTENKHEYIDRLPIKPKQKTILKDYLKRDTK